MAAALGQGRSLARNFRLGRGDNTLADWPSIRAEAARAHSERRDSTANYLLGEPLVSDFLEEALSMFGQSCEDFEVDRL